MTKLQTLLICSFVLFVFLLKNLEKHFQDAYETDESIVKYDFYIIAMAIWNMLDEQTTKTIQLPRGVHIDEIKQELFRLAVLFDKQNQTKDYTNKIDKIQSEIRELKK